MAAVNDILDATAQGANMDPTTWGPLYDNAAKQYAPAGVDPQVFSRVLQSVNHVESRGSVSATSSAGAEGNMGLMPQTSQRYGVNPRNPQQAINATAQYLRDSYAAHPGDWPTILKEYTGGPNTKNWGPRTNAYPGLIQTAYQGLGGDPTKDLGLPKGMPTITVTPQAGGFSGSVVGTAPGAVAPPGVGAGGQADSGAVTPAGTALPTGVAPPGTQVPLTAVDSILNNIINPVPPAAPQGASPAGGAAPQAPGVLPPTKLDTSIPQAAAAPPIAAQSVGPQWGAWQELANGGVLGFGPQISAAAAAAKGAFGTQSFSNNFPWMYQQALQQYQNAKSGYENQNPIAGIALPLVGSLPATTAGLGLAGEAVGAGGQALGRALPYAQQALGGAADYAKGLPLVGSALRAGGNILSGAAQGAGAGLLQSNMSNDPLWRQMETGGEVGGVLGSLSPVANATFKAANPYIEPGIASAAQKYQQLLSSVEQKFGLRPGQMTNNGFMNWLDRSLANSAHQMPAFTKQLAKTVGSDADTLTRGEFADIRNDIGNKMDDVATRTGIANDTGLRQDLDDIAQDVRANMYLPAEQAARAQIDRVLTTLQLQQILHPGNIPGNIYQGMTKKGSFIANMIDSGDPQLRDYGIKIRAALDDALERGSPARDVAKLKELRQQWKNSVVLQDLVAKAGPSGLLNPQALMGRVNRIYKSYGWDAPTDIHTLADVGKLMPNIDVTGAAKGRMYRHIFYALTGLGELGAGGLLFEGSPVAAGAAAGTASLMLGGKHAIQSALEANWYREHALGVATGQEKPIESGGELLLRMLGVKNAPVGRMAIPTATNLENYNQGAPRQ